MGLIIRNRTRGQVLARVGRIADTFGSRLLGLMFRRALNEGEALMIRPCRSVHTHFMRFPIDVIFLDREGRVLRMIAAMRPWRFSQSVSGADAVLELASGAAGETAPGDQIEWLAERKPK